MVAVRRGWRRGGNRRGWGVSALVSLEITTAPTYLFQQLPDSIVVTATNANGKTCTVTVGGEAWGSAVVTSGVATVTGTPTSAMVGASVSVSATIESVEAASTITEVFAGTLYLDARRGVTEGATMHWVDRIASLDFTEAVAASQPSYDGTKLTFDGSNDHLRIAGTSLTANTSHNICLVVALVSGAARMFDIETGRLIIDRTVAGAQQYYDGTARGTTTMGNGAQVIGYELDGVGGTGNIWRGGSAVESGLTYTPRAIGGTLSVGSSYAADFNVVNGDVHGVYIASGAALPLTPTEFLALQTRMSQYHLEGASPL